MQPTAFGVVASCGAFTAAADARSLGTLESPARPLEGTVIDILIEFLLSGILDVLFELFSDSFGRDARGRVHPIYGLLGLMFLGAVAGGFATWLLPWRLLGAPAIPGASLVVSPFLNGLLMHFYGLWRARRNGRESLAASFWGGAAFAFGFALVRVVVLSDR